MKKSENSKVAHIKNDIVNAACHLRENEVEHYLTVNKNILDYLAGEDDLSYEYFVNEKVGYRKVSQTITSVLKNKANEIYLAADIFNKKPSSENFNELINYYYIEVLANVSAYFEGKLLPARLDTNLSLIVMLCIAFFPIDEQKIIMEQLNRKLKIGIEEASERNDVIHKVCYGGSSILPLSILLYNNHPAKTPVITDLSELVSDKKTSLNSSLIDNLNDIYRQAYFNFLNDDVKVVMPIFSRLGEFHLERSQSNKKTFYEFDNTIWQYFPIEIISLLMIRRNEGKNIDSISHPVLDMFMPFIIEGYDISLNELSISLRREIFKRNQYIPEVKL